MEIFPRYWLFVRGIHRLPVNSPHKGQWCGALMFSLICASINGWVNNREAGDLRRHGAHYDVIVMTNLYDRTTPLPCWTTFFCTTIPHIYMWCILCLITCALRSGSHHSRKSVIDNKPDLWICPEGLLKMIPRQIKVLIVLSVIWLLKPCH